MSIYVPIAVNNALLSDSRYWQGFLTATEQEEEGVNEEGDPLVPPTQVSV
jgi:hypothetical protein